MQQRWLVWLVSRASPAFLVCYSPQFGAVYAPRGAKFYELAFVAIAFDPHGRRLQASSAATTLAPQTALANLGEQVLHAQPHAYER